MIRTILASAAALAVTAGAAGAQTIIYDDGYATYGAPVIVERRAAVMPGPVFVEPASPYVVLDDFDTLSPGAPTGQGATDNKRTVGDARRDALDRFYRSRPVVIYR